jgi:hypothetical protein
MRISKSATSVTSVTSKLTRAQFFLRLSGVAAALAFATAALGQQAAPAAPAAKPVATAKSPQKALDKPLWKELSQPQQVALEPLVGEWDKMDSVRKQKWLEIANRFASMKPDEQQRVHEKMRDWIKLTPEERRVARENYTRAKTMGAAKKSEKWEEYQQLPEEQKKKLAEQAASAQAKKVTNLPNAAQAKTKTVAPIQPPCPPGTVKNTAAASPACVAVTPPPNAK